MAQALDSVVVEVDLGDDRPAFFKGIRVGGEAVVLGGDRDLAGLEVLHRLIAAAMAELELESGAAESVGDHLVAEADAEDRVVGHEAGDRLVDVGECGGVAGTVGEEDAIGGVLLDLLSGGGSGENFYVETVVNEFAEDGVFGAKIEGGDGKALRGSLWQAEGGASGDVGGVEAGGVFGAPEVGLGAGGVLDVVGAGHVVPAAGAGDGVGFGDGQGGEAALHGAVHAEFFGEGAGIHITDTRDTVFGQVIAEGGSGAPVGNDGG